MSHYIIKMLLCCQDSCCACKRVYRHQVLEQVVCCITQPLIQVCSRFVVLQLSSELLTIVLMVHL